MQPITERISNKVASTYLNSKKVMQSVLPAMKVRTDRQQVLCNRHMLDRYPFDSIF